MLEYKYGTKPYAHQRDAFELSADMTYWAYFMEPGLGKSKVLVDTGAYLYLTEKIKAMVICTVKAMCPSFEFIEVPTHMPAEVTYRVFRYNSAKVKNKSFKQEWSEFLKFDGFKVFIFNIDAAASDNLIVMMRELYRSVKSSVLMGIDESTTIKTHTAKRSKAAVKFIRASKYRRIMSGTPITNGSLEIFGQAMALESPEKILGHKSFISFRNYFAEVEKKTFGNRSFQVVTGYQNTEELTRLIGTFASIVKKEDALDLPEKIYSTIIVEMPKAQREMYDKLRQEAIIELESLGETIEVTNILTMLVKLHQIVCGQIKYQDQNGKDRYASVENNRIQTLLDLIELEDGKVVIWSNYKQSLRDIVSSLAKIYGQDSVIEFHGGVPQADREVAVKRFQDPKDKGRFFVANPQSAGMGITLTISNLAIYYSNDYSLERRIQSEDRIHRIGQLRSARYIDLVSQDTVDTKILAALKEKRSFAERVIVSNWRNLI